MVMEALCKNIRSELGLEGPECQIRNKTGLEIGFWVETSTAGQDAKRVLPEIFSFPVFGDFGWRLHRQDRMQEVFVRKYLIFR
jgi:hypothetical protein